MAIHPIVGEIFRSGRKWQNTRLTLLSAVTMLALLRKHILVTVTVISLNVSTICWVWLIITDTELSNNAGDSRQVSRQTSWVGWVAKLQVQRVERATSDALSEVGGRQG